MNRKTYIEMVRRQIYGGQPADDATITVGLVNKWLDIAIAAAAKHNNKDNITIDGISYINNSFYTIFKGLSVTKDENFLWKIELPQLPLGIGTSEGISTLEFKDPTTGATTYTRWDHDVSVITNYRGMAGWECFVADEWEPLFLLGATE